MEKERTPFKKVELMLYNYNEFKQLIKDKEEEIEELEKFGSRKTCRNIASMNLSSISERLTDNEITDMKIQQVMNSVIFTRSVVNTITEELEKIKNDKYFYIIESKYFDKKNLEDIASEMNCDIATVQRNKNRLINQLAIRMFSDDYLRNLFENK